MLLDAICVVAGFIYYLFINCIYIAAPEQKLSDSLQNKNKKVLYETIEDIAS